MASEHEQAASYHEKKTLLLVILPDFDVFIFFTVFKSFVALEHEQAASYHDKNVVFRPF